MLIQENNEYKPNKCKNVKDRKLKINKKFENRIQIEFFRQ